MIEISHVSKRLSGSLVLDDISLTLPTEGLTALIGPNGAGKSTLLSLIARLDRPDQGVIRVGGLDVQNTPSRKLARVLAILRQETTLVARLRVRELVGYGRFAHCDGRLGASDHAAVSRALAATQIKDLAERFVDTLSGGQRARAFLAMILAQDTPYLLLDEPLAALDMAHARAMMRLLAQLAHQERRAVVVVLHDINFAAAHADHIVALKEGQMFAQGSAAQVIRPEVLEPLYGMDLPVAQIEGRAVVLPYA